MATRQRIARSLNFRSFSGAVRSSGVSFHMGWMTSSGEPVSEDEVMALALKLAAARVARTDVLTNPAETRRYLMLRMGDLQHEVFCCLYLDSRHYVIAFDELFRGTVDGASVHPREVVKEALARNAAAVILVHNHPSGVAEPSQADELITIRLKDALGLVDIRVLDHLIVTAGRCVSLAECGVL